MKIPLSHDSEYGEQRLLLTLDDAAKRLSVCRRTLEREIIAGRFPRPVKIGRSTRVLVASVEGYVGKLAGTVAAS